MSVKAAWEFASQTIRNFHTTGAVLPSSRFLAEAMTRPLASRPRPAWRILEVGPGTGPFTEKIAGLLGAGDSLDCYELNPRFCRHLRDRFQREAVFTRHSGKITLYEKDICRLPPEQQYDFVVSGLPFNNFTADLVKKIMSVLFRALKPGAQLSFFEYLFLRSVKTAAVGRRERKRLASIERIIDVFCARGPNRDVIIWRNIPPALVRTITKPAAR